MGTLQAKLKGLNQKRSIDFNPLFDVLMYFSSWNVMHSFKFWIPIDQSLLVPFTQFSPSNGPYTYNFHVTAENQIHCTFKQTCPKGMSTVYHQSSIRTYIYQIWICLTIFILPFFFFCQVNRTSGKLSHPFPADSREEAFSLL